MIKFRFVSYYKEIIMYINHIFISTTNRHEDVEALLYLGCLQPVELQPREEKIFNQLFSPVETGEEGSPEFLLLSLLLFQYS